MTEINIPDPVLFVYNAIRRSGYQAYLVGGCVRDSLLGLCPSDYDIATDAKPEAVMCMFGDSAMTVGTGLKHGTVTVIRNHMPVEVTTYRIDGSYSDSRRPDGVEFTGSLEDDVRRRDFTVNALAYSPESGFADYVGGLDDIKAGVIRCVGDPARRFGEDALRILRALRFSSVLGFEIEKEISAALLAGKEQLHNISNERISAEFQKLINGRNAEKILLEYREVIAVFIPEISPMFDFCQRNPYHKYDVYTHSVKAVAASPADDTLRIAAFFHDIGKPECFSTDESGSGHFYGHAPVSALIAERVLKRLRFENSLCADVVTLIKHHDSPIENDDKRIKRLMREISPELFFKLIELQKADNSAQADCVSYRRELLDKVLESAQRIIEEQSCFSRSGLAVNGDDLISAGIPQGKEIGRILSFLLEEVTENRVANNREDLLREAEKIARAKTDESEDYGKV